MREHVVPACRKMFAAHPSAASITYAVGQYWSDEADDAVHGEFVLSRERDPRWPECCDDGTEEFRGVWAHDFVPFNSGLDDNSTMITAFASFCIEERSQDDSTAEAHTPYAVIRRAPGPEVDVTVEIVGQMHRPEWEDSWRGDDEVDEEEE